MSRWLTPQCYDGTAAIQESILTRESTPHGEMRLQYASRENEAAIRKQENVLSKDAHQENVLSKDAHHIPNVLISLWAAVGAGVGLAVVLPLL